MSSSTMKAFVMPEVGKTAVVDKPIPDPGPDDVIVKTTHALICTSDVHTVAGVLPVNPGVTLGHEALGVVYATGSNVTGFVEGQRVAVNAITPCSSAATVRPATPASAGVRSADTNTPQSMTATSPSILWCHTRWRTSPPSPMR